MTDRYDAIVIGAGNAGLAASRVLADAGRRIAIVESDDFGGTCPNRGCTPKKVLVAAANAMETIGQAHVHGIRIGRPSLDWHHLIDRKRQLIEPIPGALERVAEQRGTVHRGRARFVGPTTLAVGDRVLEAADIVIATGSTPRPLAIPGAAHLATSDDLLTLSSLPESVVFLGGGVIAFEFAHVLVRAGCRVTILEALPRLLPGFDADAVDVLVSASAESGIDIRTGVRASGISEVPGGFAVTDDQGELARGALVVNGTGRVPDVERLDLEAAGIAHERGAINVDQRLNSTSNAAVWVCGDALAGSPQLSPLASEEGTMVGRNIIGDGEHRADYSVIPRSVFSIPTLSAVGLGEEQAKAAHPDLQVRRTDLSGWLSSRTHAESAAWAKTLVDAATDRVVGAQIVGHRGEELIHLFSLAMQHGIPASALAAGPFAFPTHASDVKNLL